MEENELNADRIKEMKLMLQNPDIEFISFKTKHIKNKTMTYIVIKHNPESTINKNVIVARFKDNDDAILFAAMSEGLNKNVGCIFKIEYKYKGVLQSRRPYPFASNIKDFNQKTRIELKTLLSFENSTAAIS